MTGRQVKLMENERVKNNKVFLIVLDGYGLREESRDNGVKLARTPFLHSLLEKWPHTQLTASGEDVGLPTGQMGNSEVGHLNLGAGRIVYQDITRIDLAIRRGEFYTNPIVTESARFARRNGSAWHLIGLVSDGGVHSSLNHLFALLETARREDVKRVFIHALTDGRDTPPHSGLEYLERVEHEMKRQGIGRIATVCGRYWAMDRDKRWPRVEKAYRMLTTGEGLRFNSASDAVRDSYLREVTDEFIEPSIISGDGRPPDVIQNSDSVFFFNFRADRARELTLALTNPEFPHFSHRELKLHYSTLTQYREDFNLPAAFPPYRLDNILGKVLSESGLRQFRLAETEKFAHVAYFFNGGEDTPFTGEERHIIQSPKVATYDLQPEMNAPEVADSARQALNQDYSFILLNFANPDMVGHTGIPKVILQALESLDPLVESLVHQALDVGWTILITADHGNCEQMVDEHGGPHTAHTTNPVPFIMISPEKRDWKLRSAGILADVAPTIMEIIGLPQPPEMTGHSLIASEASAAS
ncbi:MAG: 2,3-bisphosphoglycerate-independent phosphoglycerate mutase [Calditrichota bacterium]